RDEDYRPDFFEKAKELSLGAEVFAGQAWDVPMYSSARGYRGGQEVWSVVHDIDVGPRSLVAAGAPPADLVAITERRASEQKAAGDEQVDYIFEIPSDLSAAVCGYHPTEGAPLGRLFPLPHPPHLGKAPSSQPSQPAMRA